MLLFAVGACMQWLELIRDILDDFLIGCMENSHGFQNVSEMPPEFHFILKLSEQLILLNYELQR